MNDSTIRLSADTSALTDSLIKIAEEMTTMKDTISSSAAAMGANLDASAKQAEATHVAIHRLDESVKTVTDSIEAQTKTVTDLGALSKSAEARDTWTPYYEQILELDMKSKSDLERLEREHIKKLQELNAVIAENAQISEIEKNNALRIIEQDYQNQRAEIEKEAQDFLRSLNPEEEEILRLQEGYGRKLEMLLTVHRWFAPKSCPGNWLMERLGCLADGVNGKLAE